MTYTFWHAGTLIGESPLDQSSPHPRQRGGVFLPTAHGLAVFPRLTGVLTAMLDFKRELEAEGTGPEAFDVDALCERMSSSPAGRKILDVGRMLSDVEVRAPHGEVLPFLSIAFTDPREITRLARSLEVSAPALPDEPPPDAPAYIVSATFAVPLRSGGAVPVLGRIPWSRGH